ncbi:IS66-like element accessory protein TnpA [Pseudomonas koreensis]|uniref:IS66-like element accessory protein TnpA n=1 Tax=Pseudomonas koreensis TaxID=198620 RepID=UPI0038275FCF
MQPTRRSYSKSFKAQVIQECAQPGASIASIAISHSLNANLAHKWIRVQTQKNTALQPAFIPLPIQLAGANSDAVSPNICVEIQHPRGTVKVNWPTESAGACATFFRELLRGFASIPSGSPRSRWLCARVPKRR